jgi:hemerythrin-like metal-binding protein
MSLPDSRTIPTLWDDSFLTGIPTIDQQHRNIAKMGAKILQEARLPLVSERFGDFFVEFWQLLADHFETEEKLMRTLDLPDETVQAHFREHSALLERLIQANIHSLSRSEWKHVSDISQELISIIVDHLVRFDACLKNTAT